MTRRLIRRDPARGVDVYVDIDADGGFLFSQVQRTAGLQTLINEQRAEYERTRTNRRRSQEHMQCVAHLPMIIVNRLMQAGIWGDTNKMREWLNDPAHRDFRAGGGRL